MAMKAELRGTLRLDREMAVTLVRQHGNGNPVESRTRNISNGGMCVATPRPLAIDALLEFPLETGSEGAVRVRREHSPNVCARRSEQLSPEAVSRLERLA